MEFRIADTFTDSLSRLTGDEQKSTKTTAFDLQINQASSSMNFHRLEKAKDKNFYSLRVNSDIRLIVHKTSNSLLLCYVDHHDKAYDWAERRKLETHPKTGAAQLVEIRETVAEIFVPVYKQAEVNNPKPLLFDRTSDEELLSYGVPLEWIKDVKQVDEDTLLLLADRLPAEAAEALLELATGGKPRVTEVTNFVDSPFDHPDALRRFRVMANVDELKLALEFPWEKWTVFLHPEQRQFVERQYSGPARVSGSAGTGKTIVALHRAVNLARANEDSRILLTTFSDTLAKALHTKLGRLIGSNEPRLAERIDVQSIDTIGKRLYKMHCGVLNLVDKNTLKSLILKESELVLEHKFSQQFLLSEWEQIVDAWQLKSWEEYRDVSRLGRKTRLPEAQRLTLWSIYKQVISQLNQKNMKTLSGMFSDLASKLTIIKNPLFNFIVVDEAQDISISHLKFLAALGNSRPDSLFFAGDLGQRIFQQPFSWKSIGVDIRGRSRTLRINYRTSHQIRQQADKLLGPESSDIDGNIDIRSDTVSVFNGPQPIVKSCVSEKEEIELVSSWIKEKTKDGLLPHEFGVFVRSESELTRAQDAVLQSGLKFKILDEKVDTTSDKVSISSMHLAKGLEFRAVVVMACDDEVIPSQDRIEAVGDDADLQEVYETERHLLYVACTRARDYLLVTGVDPASEFLDDLIA